MKTNDSLFKTLVDIFYGKHLEKKNNSCHNTVGKVIQENRPIFALLH